MVLLIIKIAAGLFLTLLGLTYWYYREQSLYSETVLKSLKDATIKKNQERAKVSILETKIKSLEQSLESNETSTESHTTVDTNSEELEKKNQELESKLNDIAKENQCLQKMTDELNGVLQEMETFQEQLVTERDQLSDQLSDLQKANKKQDQALKDLKKSLNNETKIFEEKLSKLKPDEDKWKGLLDDMQKKLDNKDLEVNDLKQLVDNSIKALQEAKNNIESRTKSEPVKEAKKEEPPQTASPNEITIIENIFRRQERRYMKACRKIKELERKLNDVVENSHYQTSEFTLETSTPQDNVIEFPVKPQSLAEVEIIKSKIDQARKDLYAIQSTMEEEEAA